MAAVTVYIDEAGDPGIKRYSNGDPRYEWFTLAGVAVRSEDDSKIVEWLRAATSGMKGKQAADVHYRNLTAGGKLAVCQSIGQRPLRAFVVASHKSNMRRHLNPRLSTEEQASRFYNWCVRLMLERVTEWATCHSTERIGDDEMIRLVFSDRGGHSYSKLFWYLFTKLRWQEEARKLYLPRPVIRGKLDRSLVEVIKHENRAGLQLADIVASSFLQAANSSLSTFDMLPAKHLRRIMARPRPKASKAAFGVTLLPLPEQAVIPEEDRGIFRYYGFEI